MLFSRSLSFVKHNPGLTGWLAVGAIVGLADGYALRTRRQTMSAFFATHSRWAAVIWGGATFHLLFDRRTNG